MPFVSFFLISRLYDEGPRGNGCLNSGFVIIAMGTRLRPCLTPHNGRRALHTMKIGNGRPEYAACLASSIFSLVLTPYGLVTFRPRH